MVEKFEAASEEGTIIESIVEKDTEISKDDAKTVQDEKDVQMKVPTTALERGLEVVIDIEKECAISETIWRSTIKAVIDFTNTCERERPRFIDFICKSIIDDSLRW